MHTEQATDDHADVLVIGAGASGGVVALALARAGVRVVCLERGEWPDRAAFPGATPAWELAAAKQWSSLPDVRANPADYPIDQAESERKISNFNGVGGGTIVFNGQWPRLLPDDFRVRSIDGIADDWPITYDELAPYYDRTDREFGVSGLGGNPRYPTGDEPPLPPLPIGPAGLRLARAHAQLGWHWWPEYNAILSAPYDGRRQCVQRGTCSSGCNEGAKASTDLTHWPKAIAAGARLVTGARVTRVLVDGQGLACGALWVDDDGHEHVQRADAVVMAANAVGTARLLLASACDTHPDGLANSSGLVGRRLMLHPVVGVTGVFDEHFGFSSHFGGLVQCLEFAGSDQTRGFARGAKWGLSIAGGPMKALFASTHPRGVWGDGHHEAVREHLGHSASWAIVCEDLPDVDNRVELSPTMVDRDGLAAPRISYRLSDHVRRNMEFQAERGRESMLAAGAREVDVVFHGQNGHLMGTARMGDDPASSVVDRWGFAHDVANLAIADGSVFVTGGCSNPTSTIVALALRTAEQLLERRASLPRPSHARSFAVGEARQTSTAVSIPTPAVGLSAAARARLVAAADVLIPPTASIPSAGEVVDRQLAALFEARPDLREPLARVLADASIDATEHAQVRYAVAGAYYLDPLVRAAIAYPGTEPHPVRPLDYPEFLAEGLLDHLVG